MKATEETRHNLVLAMSYAKTAQTYMGIDWEISRCFVELASYHWHKVRFA